MIQENTDPKLHLLSIHLDDCRMRDADMAALLSGINSSQKFQSSLQSLTYANNEWGALSTEQFKLLLGLKITKKNSNSETSPEKNINNTSEGQEEEEVP